MSGTRSTRGEPGETTRVAFRLALVLLAATACAGPPPGPVPATSPPAAASEEDVASLLGAHRALVAAFESANVDGFVGWLDPSPQLLLFHPRLYDRFDDVDEMRGAMTVMFARLGPTRWSEAHPTVQIRGDVAWLTSHVVVEPSQGEAFVGRATEIWIRQASGWRLSHAHWSVDPEAGPP